jgi:hypothetical protein
MRLAVRVIPLSLRLRERGYSGAFVSMHRRIARVQKQCETDAKALTMDVTAV